MSGPNRLLDMLKSATLPSSIAPPSDSASSSSLNPSSHPTALTGDTLAPSGQSGSPREPSPSPPPPSLQAVSLQDLFASITGTSSNAHTSPPAITSPATHNTSSTARQSSTSPLDGAQHHQNNLLGMLKGIGNSPNPFTQPHTNGEETPSAAREKALGGTESPFSGTFGAVGSGYSTPQAVHVQNQTTASTNDHAEPVITHPIGAPTNTATATARHASPSGRPIKGLPIPAKEREQSKGPSKPAQAQNGQSPSVPSAQWSGNTHQPAAQASPAQSQAQPPSAAPQKSPFDFVSPFSVFDKPKAGTPAKEKEEAKLIGSPAPGGTPITGLPNPATPATATAKRSTNTPPESVQNVPRSRQTSTSGTRDLGLPWLVTKLVQKGVEGQGPKPSNNQINIDLSKPGVDSLANSPGTVQVIPTTILKADSIGYSKGRTVGITSNWVAYTLARGRVRLIDASSGGRLVLTIPDATGPILDLAVTPTSVAVVGSDNSVAVWEVPSAWEQDDPQCRLIALLTPSTSSRDERIGPVERVDWVLKNGEPPRLAIAGDRGVVIVRPDQLANFESTADLELNHKVMQPEGSLAAFCLNHSHQAIALISPRGFLTLYNVSNCARVWHRQLPFAGTSKSPSVTSVLFCESNILVGSENNTRFDLFQITVEITCLASITFTSPSPSPAHLHFSQAAYDTTRSTLWIAPFSRGSLYAFRYALKGVPPAKKSDRPDLVAFDKLMEIPLEPVSGFVVGQKGIGDDAEIFYATPNGFSHAIIERSICETFSSAPTPRAQPASVPASAPIPVPTQPAAETPQQQQQKQVEEVKKDEEIKREKSEQGRRGSRQPKKGSPLVIKEELPSENEEPQNGGQQESVLSLDDLERLFKKSDDRNSTNLRNVLTKQLSGVTTRLDTISNGELANEIAKAVEKTVKSTLNTIVQNEIKRSVIPALQATVQLEVRNVINSSVPLAVSSAVQNIPVQVEKSLTPVIQRSMATVIHSTVEKALQDSLHSTVLPALSSASNGLANQLSAEVKSELVQIRKDLPTGQEVPVQLDVIVRTLADLQRQVATLTERLSRQPPPAPGPVQNAVPHGAPSIPTAARSLESPQQPQPPAVQQYPLSPPPPHPIPSPNQLNDIFFQALSATTTGSTAGLVNEYWWATEEILPHPPASSPLTQAMILTLLHRLALALSDLNPADPLVNKIASWEKRAATLINPRDPDVNTFFNRVMPVIQTVLNNVQQHLSRVGTNEEALRTVRGALDVLAQKL